MNFEASLQSGDQTAVVHRGVVMVMVMMVGIVTVMERRRRSMIYDDDVDDIMVPWYRSVWLCVANQCNVPGAKPSWSHLADNNDGDGDHDHADDDDDDDDDVKEG